MTQFIAIKSTKTESDIRAWAKCFQKFNFELPSIYTQNGLFFRGSLIEILAGPLTLGKYAQAAIQQDLSIGEVSSVSGSAKATRIDGTTFDLSTGDPVFQGDKIEVSSSGAVGLVFLDQVPSEIILTAKLKELLGSRGENWEILTTGAFVSMTVPLFIFFALQRYFIRGLVAGSVKG